LLHIITSLKLGNEFNRFILRHPILHEMLNLDSVADLPANGTNAGSDLRHPII
jgi:hypothetical protein